MKAARNFLFLKDVALLSVVAFGGPNAHIALMLRRFVRERAYLKEEELVELMALCQLLPGPTSTQTLCAVAYRRGGVRLALMALGIWLLPAVMIMTSLGFVMIHFGEIAIGKGWLSYVLPVAAGLMFYAAWTIGKKVVKRWIDFAILVASVAACLVASSPWAFPGIILSGALIGALYDAKRIQPVERRKFIRPKWGFIWIPMLAVVIVAVIGILSGGRYFVLFENMARFGSLVFGGGQVLIPMMLEQFTEHHQWLSGEEFLTGYAMQQVVPGPVFSFSAYAGVLVMRDYGLGGAIAGAAIAAVGLFLPGTLLIFAIYPMWQFLKEFQTVRHALRGVNAAAGGLVAAAAILFVKELGIELDGPILDNVITGVLIIGSALLLTFTRVAAPALVLGALAAGLIIFGI